MKTNQISINTHKTLTKLLQISAMPIKRTDASMLVETPALTILQPPNPSVLYPVLSFHNKIKAKFFSNESAENLKNLYKLV